MAMFQNKGQGDLAGQVTQLREQGLTDDMIVQELSQKGFSEPQIISQLSKVGAGAPPGSLGGMPPTAPESDSIPDSSFSMPSAQQGMPPQMPSRGNSSSSGMGGSADSIYSRIEEMTESLIDEKWDELVSEVKKIVAWKEKVEEKTKKLEHDVMKLSDDFKTLHQAVLGKVEEYDSRMRDVGTELKAVGKVFKDVVPIFTENVKELKHITSGMKSDKKE
jgi:hypothetical protein